MSDSTLGFVALGMLFVGVLTGYPMAFTFLFIALAFGYVGFGEQVFYLLNYQVFGVMQDTVLAAVPLFLFMGYVLEQSGLMERLFKALRMLLGRVNGALYLVVLLVATVFAAATGIVGASVTVLGVMAAPIMQSSHYDTGMSAGSITAGGTLGILIPPSIMLIVMGPIVGVPVASLFTAAIVPGLILASTYIGYTLIRCYIRPELGPRLSEEEIGSLSPSQKLSELLLGVVPVTIVIAATLGAIIAGVTTPTDAAATGSLAALVLALAYRRMTWQRFKTCVFRTLETSAFIMLLIVVATFFGAVFTRLGSAQALTEALVNLPLPPLLMLAMILGIVFLLGWPLDWIPIVLIVVPIFLPTVQSMGFDLLWFTVLVAVTMQTAWLTPPLALSALFLKGVAPSWSMGDIYRGMVPFVVLQLLVVALLIAFPELVFWLPNLVSD